MSVAGIHTHPRIDRALCGEPTALSAGAATVVLRTTERMAADDEGLVHGGFVFGAADYAAMLAVNHPLVVLAAAELRFLAPVRAGEVVTLRAVVESQRGRKQAVRVEGAVEAEGVEPRAVLSGLFTAAVLDQHVLSRT